MTEAQLQALASEGPPWMYELLAVLHLLTATVITTNYDNIVECAVARGRAPLVAAGGRWRPLAEDDIVAGRPRRADFLRFEDMARDLEQQGTGVRMNLAILARTAGHLFGEHARFPTFCLLKLHGSLNGIGCLRMLPGTRFSGGCCPALSAVPIPRRRGAGSRVAGRTAIHCSSRSSKE